MLIWTSYAVNEDAVFVLQLEQMVKTSKNGDFGIRLLLDGI